MVNFSVGLGSFAQGLGQGMQMGSQIKGVIDQRKMRNLAKDGQAEANAAREGAINSAIETTSNADGTQSFKVGDQTFSDQGKAKNAAAQQVGSVMDFYRQTTVPKLIQGYLDIGDPDKAQQLQSWMETREAEGITRDWARGARLAMLGDTKGAMRKFGKLYEKLEPGSKYVGMEDITEPNFEERTLPGTGETIRIENGTRPAGVRLKLRNADGEEVSHDFTSSDDLYQTAMMTLSPDKFVGRAFSELDKASAARAAAAKDDREFRQDVALKRMGAAIDDQRDARQHTRQMIRSDREFGQTTQRDATQQGYDLEKIMTSKQLDAALAPAMEAAKVKGDTPEDARKAISAIWKTLSESDLGGKGGFNSKPVDEQVKQATNIYSQQSTAARGVIQGAAPDSNQGRGIPKLW
ncbi:hypothetical protein [Sphingobium yanoikuyae]|uniref:Uncharacterized protein n=1 Tax=Sphingobium yanoikuyae TaxID=13690 RepID=A0A3G2UNP6_SPHYA|nr:hypothetical protein [Sphingobium yanoikuyae]AYO76425.1 hypothetical protein EBF16_05390 [Sphingobium yanoikuyae]